MYVSVCVAYDIYICVKVYVILVYVCVYIHVINICIYVCVCVVFMWKDILVDKFYIIFV